MKELPIDHIQRNIEDTKILTKIADELENGFGEKVEELDLLCIELQRFIDEKRESEA